MHAESVDEESSQVDDDEKDESGYGEKSRNPRSQHCPPISNTKLRTLQMEPASSFRFNLTGECQTAVDNKEYGDSIIHCSKCVSTLDTELR